MDHKSSPKDASAAPYLWKDVESREYPIDLMFDDVGIALYDARRDLKARLKTNFAKRIEELFGSDGPSIGVYPDSAMQWFLNEIDAYFDGLGVPRE